MAEAEVSPPLKVLILGHSFVRRATDYMETHNTMNNLSLSYSTHDIQFISRPGCHARNLCNAFPQVRLIKPSLVFLDIGTNDLTVMSPDQLFTQVHEVARELIQSCGVNRVVLLQVLPRTVHGRWGQPQPFQDKVARYNELIKTNVYQNKLAPMYAIPRLAISFWFHKGFRQDIASLIVDGVHLNSTGLPLYIRSIKRAVLKFSPRVRFDLTH